MAEGHDELVVGETVSMATLTELLDALDKRILEALEAKATGETIVRLFEARAWLTNPEQGHGSPSAQV